MGYYRTQQQLRQSIPLYWGKGMKRRLPGYHLQVILKITRDGLDVLGMSSVELTRLLFSVVAQLVTGLCKGCSIVHLGGYLIMGDHRRMKYPGLGLIVPSGFSPALNLKPESSKKKSESESHR